MSIRKVSDLPSIDPNQGDFNNDRLAQSLLEISYYTPTENSTSLDDGSVTFQSRYMQVGTFVDVAIDPKLGSIWNEIKNISVDLGDLSARVNRLSTDLSGLSV